ncbi:MAG: fumarylacetoacetate hydrolase family protein [Gammaproteobacteria bacterium]|nr:fumarylacetoacetate hydrolase family protein [Gammaproteobacteria bacterium]
MKLASLKTGGRDGTPVVVSRDLSRMALATTVVPNLQAAIDNWAQVSPLLQQLSDKLENEELDSQPYNPVALASPLPRAYQWADGSAYLSHMRLVRKARGAEMPENSNTDPMLYQGGSDGFLGPVDPIPCVDTEWGLDFEGEIAVITDDVPMGCTVAQAESHIKLIMLCNDISLRHVMRPELMKGFGFFQSKPASAFSPVCVTPDELGDAWTGGRVNLPLLTTYNGEKFGQVHAGKDLTFEFPDLIAHAARTRDLCAGTIIGSGTVSNENHDDVGSNCLAEKRMIEVIRDGKPATRFMQPGDTIRFEMLDRDEHSVFGAIDQTVIACSL